MDNKEQIDLLMQIATLYNNRGSAFQRATRNDYHLSMLNREKAAESYGKADTFIKAALNKTTMTHPS